MAQNWQVRSNHGVGRMRHPGTRLLYTYWDRLRAGRPAPERGEIEPGDIGAVLSDTFILEVVDDDLYPYRLAGTRICSAFGREMKAANWLDGWPARDREALATLLRSISSAAAGAVVEFEGRNAAGQVVPFESLLLPLTAGGSGYRRILGIMLALDQPYWLGAKPVVDRRVTGLRLIWPHEHDSAMDEGMTGWQAVLDAMLPLRRMRHLALYDGGRPD